ncbi:MULTISPECIES: hypothetical protein [Pseudonocardia]|uniref:Uncharacterized protein n=2 Tax=Pseudonocardia TaxID=1847 RepID=A0A1Y2N5D1_PSEAH|nr:MULTISPECIES: hypothetical protein [Pseudonocardia]OSY42128.1 hypothetical protein BG845_01624 [Pseudonocardia autotrophica]TDN75104.1 hypothetical protein C8E95_4247 [Pseudonocardia autotrophica]GEC23969.1 hypothetical protein PSA01_09980 [Pseudonocardia saturnea]
MRRIARWSTAIAVVVLTVLAAGVLAAGPGFAEAPVAAVAAGEHSHECHGAPLQDVHHSAATPVRGADAELPLVAPGPILGCLLPAPVRTPERGASDPAPVVGSRVSNADLQVFRI